MGILLIIVGGLWAVFGILVMIPGFEGITSSGYNSYRGAKYITDGILYCILPGLVICGLGTLIRKKK